MRESKEQKERHIAWVREALALKPDLTIGELRINLQRNAKRDFSPGYLTALRRKVVSEQIKRINSYTKKRVMAQLMDRIQSSRNIALQNLAQPLTPFERLATARFIKECAIDEAKMLLLSGVLEDPRYADKVFGKDEGEARSAAPVPPDVLEAQRIALMNSGVLATPSEVDAMLAADESQLAEEEKEMEEEARREEEEEKKIEEEKRKAQEERDAMDLANLRQIHFAEPALKMPPLERARGFRETYGLGEEAKDYDKFWKENTGNKWPHYGLDKEMRQPE